MANVPTQMKILTEHGGDGRSIPGGYIRGRLSQARTTLLHPGGPGGWRRELQL